MIEVHSSPDCALCDGPQAIDPAMLPDLIGQIRRIGDIARDARSEDPR